MKKPEKMTVAEWNEFVRDCKWCVIEEVPDLEEVERIRAAINDLDEESRSTWKAGSSRIQSKIGGN